MGFPLLFKISYMMKIAILISIVLFASCQKPEPSPSPDVALTLGVEEVFVQHEATEVTVAVTADGGQSMDLDDVSFRVM